jgi:hypothetical protein
MGWFLFFLAGGLICGIASATVAGSKNRFAVGWFFGGLFLGPIALFTVGFMPALKGTEERVAGRLCPFCAEKIQPAAIVCKHCGREVGAQELEIAQLATPHHGEGDAETVGTIKIEKTGGGFHAMVLSAIGILAVAAFAAMQGRGNVSQDPGVSESGGMEAQYAKAWHYGTREDISHQLLKEGVSDCPRYAWKPHKHDATAYLVYCADGVGKWAAYTIYNGRLFGPYAARPELSPKDMP